MTIQADKSSVKPQTSEGEICQEDLSVLPCGKQHREPTDAIHVASVICSLLIRCYCKGAVGVTMEVSSGSYRFHNGPMAWVPQKPQYYSTTMRPVFGLLSQGVLYSQCQYTFWHGGCLRSPGNERRMTAAQRCMTPIDRPDRPTDR